MSESGNRRMQQCLGGSHRSISIPSNSSAASASTPTSENNTIKFNKFGFPVGKKSGCISSARGKITKTFAPLCYKDWKLVPVEHKNDIWRELKAKFTLDESQRKFQLKACGNSWKKLKNKLRKKVIDEYPGNLMKQKSTVPAGIRSEDWEKFCDYEATEEAKQARKDGAKLRLKRPKSTHNTGRDGYARTEEKMREESDDPLSFNPNRAEVWLKSHRRPDGSFSPEHADHAEKIIQLLQEFYDGKGGEMTLDNDPIALTFGIDKRGLVRGVGSVSRTTILSSDYATSQLENVDCERSVWMAEVKGLNDQICSVESKVQETVKSQLSDFYDKLKGDFFQGQPAESVERTPSTVPRSTSALGNGIQLCTILDHAKEVLGYGRREGHIHGFVVHQHALQPHEERIIVDTVLKPNYKILGGKQGGATTLGDAAGGGYLYWPTDMLGHMPTTLGDAASGSGD